jgi:hypothetical protein
MTERVADDDHRRMLDAVLSPLLLPRRLVQDLEAIGEAARSLPDFERTVIARMDDLGVDVRSMGAELNASVERLLAELARLDHRVSTVQDQVPDLARDLAATKALAGELRDQVGDAVEHLPDPNSRGPIARARDVITGADPPADGA